MNAVANPSISPPKKPDPCSLLPKVPPITIPTPFGIDLKSIVDPSKGAPSDCALVHSLMLQITPMLAGFTCILKVLNLVAAIKKALTATPPLIGGLSDLTKAIDQMGECIGLVNPLPWLGMIKGILLMVLGYIECLIEGFESIRRLKVGVDLGAGGTPVLISTLNCASSNGDTSMDALMSSMEPVQPLLQILDLIGGIIGLPLGLPSLSAGGSSGSDPLQPIIDFHDALLEVVQKLPG